MSLGTKWGLVCALLISLRAESGLGESAQRVTARGFWQLRDNDKNAHRVFTLCVFPMELWLPAASLGSGRRNRFPRVLLWGPRRWLRRRDVATSRIRRDFLTEVRILVLSVLQCGHSAPTK